MTEINLKEETDKLIKLAENKEEFVKQLHYLLSSIGGKIPDEIIRVYIGTKDNYFGVHMPELNAIGKDIGIYSKKNPDKTFELIKVLWQKGYYEDKLIVGKIFERLGKVKPKESLEFIRNCLREVDNWAVCDNFANFGTKGIVKKIPNDIFALGEELVKSEKKWERRFAITVQLNTEDVSQILKIADEMMAEKDKDVRRGVSWALREASKISPKKTHRFLLKHCEDADKDKAWIIRDGLKKLPKEMQDEILKILVGKKLVSVKEATIEGKSSEKSEIVGKEVEKDTENNLEKMEDEKLEDREKIEEKQNKENSESKKEIDEKENLKISEEKEEKL